MAILMTAAACSGGADSDPAAYCDALEMMFNAQPAGGLVTDSFEGEMMAYAATAKEAAALAPEGQSDALGNFAEFLEGLAVDPTAEGTGEQAFALMASMLAIQNHAENECGIDVEAIEASLDPDEPAPPVRTDVSDIPSETIVAINALVPAGFELTFESFTTEDEERVSIVAAPTAWEADHFLGTTFEPPDDSGFGFFTEMEIGDSCDGICGPQDWTTKMDDSESGPFALLTGPGVVLLDRELESPQGRVVVYQDDDAFHPVEVVLTRWDDRADRYFKCEASLDEDDIDLWPAFVAACEASVALWIPVS